MSGKVMISLIGEQTVPNVVPLLHYSKLHGVERSILVHSGSLTDRCGWIEGVVRSKSPASEQQQLLISGYDLAAATKQLKALVEAGIKQQGWQISDLVFNFTGGTKIMALALYGLATTFGCEAVYYQTDDQDDPGRGPRIQSYITCNGELLASDISPLEVLDIESYFAAHGLTVSVPQTDPRAKLEQNIRNAKDAGSRRGYQFEVAVYDALLPVASELMLGVTFPGFTSDIDLVVRLDNLVGVVQLKSGGEANGLKGIEQTTLFSGVPYGTYTKRLIIDDGAANVQDKHAEHIKKQNIKRCRISPYNPATGISDVEGLREQVIAALRASR